MVHSTQTDHLSYVKFSTISKQTQTSLHLSLWYIRLKPCTYITPTLTMSPNGPKQNSTGPTHRGVPSEASNTISERMVHSTQNAHLSCIKITTSSKWTQTSIHLSLVTKEYHRVRPKQFLSLWSIRRKPCSYIAPTLTLSSNGLKRDFTCPTHLGLTSGAFKTIFVPMVRLAQIVHLSCVKISTISKRLKQAST
jgi:hypothetical protein